jgi:hypothetical protein
MRAVQIAPAHTDKNSSESLQITPLSIEDNGTGVQPGMSRSTNNARPSTCNQAAQPLLNNRM